MPALLALFVAALTLLGACSADPKLPSCGVGASASARSQGYELGAGDRLEVTVFRHEDLSGEFRLNATGAVAMPSSGRSRRTT